MPNFVETLGLDFLFDDEESGMGFIGYLAKNGKAITGYYGLPSFFNDMGSVDFFIKTAKNDEGQLEFAGFDTHCSGLNVWEMRNSGIDITPKDSLPTEKACVFNSHVDGSGMLPIHIINADVLPSFFKDDVVKMQMCAFALDVNYYANEQEYADAQPKAKDGQKWLLADGSFFPTGFLTNHSLDKKVEEPDYSTDDLVLFRGTVKKLFHGHIEINGEKLNTYISCVVDTMYGELHFNHTIDQVDEEQRCNIKVGSVIAGVCVLSGDVAIYEYEKGIVKDFDHNLRLLRHVIVNGEAERMRSVLCNDAVYISGSSNTYEGIDAVIDRFNTIHDAQDSKCFATPATVTSVDCDDLEYPVGTRCLLISYKDENVYDAIAFIDVTEEGDIKRIYVTEDGRYHFKADDKLRTNRDIKLPENIIEPLLNRAKFHNMIDRALSVNNLTEDIPEYSTWNNNATNMLDALQENPQSDVEVAFTNIFGYLFAKAIEMSVNKNKRDNFETSLLISYSPDDAFVGEISSELDEEDHAKLVSAMELGKQFFKDLKFFTEMSVNGENDFMDNLINSLIVVQHIGSLYADKVFE